MTALIPNSRAISAYLCTCSSLISLLSILASRSAVHRDFRVNRLKTPSGRSFLLPSAATNSTSVWLRRSDVFPILTPQRSNNCSANGGTTDNVASRTETIRSSLRESATVGMSLARNASFKISSRVPMMTAFLCQGRSEVRPHHGIRALPLHGPPHARGNAPHGLRRQRVPGRSPNDCWTYASPRLFPRERSCIKRAARHGATSSRFGSRGIVRSVGRRFKRFFRLYLL